MLLHTSFPFAIYGVHLLSDHEHCIIGGGGGMDIPNQLLLYNYVTKTIVSQYDSSKDQIIWSTCFNSKTNQLLFTSKDQLHLLELKQNNKWNHLHQIELFHIPNNANKKPIQSNGNELYITCNDANQIILFTIQQDSIQLLCQTDKSDKELIDLNIHSHCIASISSQHIHLYHYENKELVLKYSFNLTSQLPYPLQLKHEFKSIQFTNENAITVLCSGKRLPSYLLFLNQELKQYKPIQMIAKQGGCTSVLEREQFKVVTQQQGYQIRNSKNRVIYSHMDLHGLPITCLDFKYDSTTQQLQVLSGSFDYSVHLQSIATNYSWTIPFLIMMIGVMLCLCYMWYF